MNPAADMHKISGISRLDVVSVLDVRTERVWKPSVIHSSCLTSSLTEVSQTQMFPAVHTRSFRVELRATFKVIFVPTQKFNYAAAKWRGVNELGDGSHSLSTRSAVLERRLQLTQREEPEWVIMSRSICCHPSTRSSDTQRSFLTVYTEHAQVKGTVCCFSAVCRPQLDSVTLYHIVGFTSVRTTYISGWGRGYGRQPDKLNSYDHHV